MIINKAWINKKETGHNFIFFSNNILYRRKVKENQFSLVKNEINQGKISDKFIGIPINYMKRIEYRDDDRYININFGSDSLDSIESNDQKTRKEVFEYLKNNTAIKRSYVAKPSVLSRIKKPLIALLVISGIFAYVYSIIDGLSQGYEYELVGRHGRKGGGALGGVVLGLAELGLTKNLFIFMPLALIAIIRIKLNIDNNSDINYIEY